MITKSDCVMDGYWQNPAANAETLRGGWLHTGDLASMDADGLLTLRDRSKDNYGKVLKTELRRLLEHGP